MKIVAALLAIPVVALAQSNTLLEPPKHVAPPSAEQSATNRAFTGIPSIAVTPGGRLWADWYAGPTPGEDKNNYAVLSTSADSGKTWREVLVVDPDGDGPKRAFDPELWMGPDGKLRMFWAQSVGHECTTGGVWMMETSEPESETPTWSAPVRVTDGVMMCKPLVLSSGEWVLPASTWRNTDFSAKMVVSSDGGKTWSVRGACHVPKEAREFDEHMFVERKDGSLWLLVRTKYGIGESVSNDRGKTWPELKPSALPHPSARFFISRLGSGNLLLVKHGALDKRTGRCLLTAFLSRDDGVTWTGGLLLDERNGVSYPDGQQSRDGLIRVIYDFDRTRTRHILMASFREEDVAAGQPVSGAVSLRTVVSQGSGGAEQALPALNANSDGSPLIRTPSGAWSCGAAPAAALVRDAALFEDRSYVCGDVPDALKGAQFLRVRLDGQKTLWCSRSGMLYVLTPLPERNRDSASSALLSQGFQKVLLPEVRLFDPHSPANLSTLFQKACREGDTVSVGKWGVPLFFP